MIVAAADQKRVIRAATIAVYSAFLDQFGRDPTDDEWEMVIGLVTDELTAAIYRHLNPSPARMLQ